MMARFCVVLLTMTLLALTGVARAEPVLDPEEYALWTLINEYRQDNGLPPLGLNDQLTAAAEWMSEDMAGNDRYSHIDSLGRSLRQRLTDFEYTRYTETGENLAADWDTAQEAFDAWKGSPEHNVVVLAPYFWAIGIARAYDEASTYGWYWAVDFGGRGPAWFPPEATPTPVPTPVLSATATPVPTPTAAPVPNGLPYLGTKP